MITSIARAILMLSLIGLLGYLGGIVWACAGVGLGFASHALVTVLLTARATALPAVPYLVNCVRPVFACVPMFGVIMAMRPSLVALHTPVALALALEVVVGAAVYLGAAFLFARSNVRELIGLVRGSRKDS